MAQLSDRQLVAAFLRATEGLPPETAGAFVGVSHETVRRWKRGDWKRIYPGTRRAIQEYLREHGGGEPESSVLDLFSNVENVTRFLEGIAPPGKEREMKLEALEAYRRWITTRKPLPAWWPELRRRIENDEL